MRASAVIGCIKRGWGGVRFENPDAPETIGHLWNAGGKPPTGFVRTVRWAIGRQPPRPSRRDAPDSHGGGTTTGGRSPAHNVVVHGKLRTSWVSPKFTIDCVL